MDAADPAALVRDYPDSAAVRLRLLNAQIGANASEGAMATLDWLARRGHIFSQGAQTKLASLAREWGTAERLRLQTAPTPILASRELAVVPAAAQLVEAVVRDPVRGRIFASTVASRQLWVLEADGRWHGLNIPGADNLSGMVLDRKNGLLWVASSNLEVGTGPDDAFHGVIGIDLATLKPRRRIAAMAKTSPSDLGLGCDGTLYASDPLHGGVYRAKPGSASFDVLVPPGSLRSAQGLATSPDCRSLVVSDYGYGLAAIRLKDGKLWRVSAPGDLSVPLDGIDGLWRDRSWLVAVQNGTSPKRIVRFKVSADGLTVRSAQIIEQAHPAWSEPLSGSLSGHSLVYVATGQWDRFDRRGAIAGKPLSATQLRIVQLRTTKH